MLKKNVFLRTTKFKAPILQIQAKDNSNVSSHSKEAHIEESLLSNQSSSTRTGSREKILPKNINTTFAMSDSQTSSSNKIENKIKSKRNFDLIEAGLHQENQRETDSNQENQIKNGLVMSKKKLIFFFLIFRFKLFEVQTKKNYEQ